MEQTLQTKVQEMPERDPQVGFDMRTHIYDAKTGKMIRYQPYVRYADKTKGVAYERDGKFFYETGELADVKVWGEPASKSMTRKITSTSIEELQAKIEEQERTLESLRHKQGAQNVKAG